MYLLGTTAPLLTQVHSICDAMFTIHGGSNQPKSQHVRVCVWSDKVQPLAEELLAIDGPGTGKVGCSQECVPGKAMHSPVEDPAHMPRQQH